MKKVGGSTFKRRGLLNSRERVSLFIGAPFVLVVLCVEVTRIWRAALGEPLLITGLTDPELTVEWAANPFLFVLGVGFHLTIVMILLMMLWSQWHQARRWLRSKRG